VAPWKNDSDELATLKTWLELAGPDDMPCDLAEIIGRPCKEVFAQRSFLMRNEYILPSTEEDDGKEGSDLAIVYQTPRLPVEKYSAAALQKVFESGP